MPQGHRGLEYFIGYVHRTREFGVSEQLVQQTYFASVSLRELLARTDLQVLPNVFVTRVHGPHGLHASTLEGNIIVTHRIIDRVNDRRVPQADRAVGLAQWGVSVRGFIERSLTSPRHFESHGAAVVTSVELFSGPLQRGTLILEGGYEWRKYDELNASLHLPRLALRVSF